MRNVPPPAELPDDLSDWGDITFALPPVPPEETVNLGQAPAELVAYLEERGWGNEGTHLEFLRTAQVILGKTRTNYYLWRFSFEGEVCYASLSIALADGDFTSEIGAGVSSGLTPEQWIVATHYELI